MAELSLRFTQYRVVFWFTQLVGLLAFLLLLIWVLHYRNGLSWSLSEFNWHILCLPLGVIHLCAVQLMAFRTLRDCIHRKVKLLHAALAVPVLILLVIGYWTVTGPRFAAGRYHFFSLHSWIGNLTALLYLFQGAVGGAAYLWPKADAAWRASFLPLHVFLGLTTFVMAVATTLLGMFEMITKIDGYYTFSGQGVMMNLCGTLYTVYAVLVVFTTTWSGYGRQTI